MMFGVPHLLDALQAGFAIVVVYFVYRTYSANRQGRRNMTMILSRTDEIAAQAHSDAARIATLLGEIKDRLDCKP